jgi:hypothetical protein
MGKAFSLVSDRDIDSLQRIESYLKQSIPTFYIEDTDIIKDFIPLHKVHIAPYAQMKPRRPKSQAQRDHSNNRNRAPSIKKSSKRNRSYSKNKNLRHTSDRSIDTKPTAFPKTLIQKVSQFMSNLLGGRK